LPAATRPDQRLTSNLAGQGLALGRCDFSGHIVVTVRRAPGYIKISRVDRTESRSLPRPERLWATPPDLTTAIRCARTGDEDAFGVLYRDIQPRMLRYLRTMVGADAEDVASETWLNVARDLGQFEGDSDGFRGWVATIARHRATDHLRHAQRRPQSAGIEAAELETWAASDDTEHRALESVATDAAIALIARLPRDQSEAVLLRVVVGLDTTSAAKVLGKRPGAVRTSCYRGLRRLSRWVEADGAGLATATARSQTDQPHRRSDQEYGPRVTSSGEQTLKGTR
jgi:RNA polymerase sigma-70 factor (ECF subfamily)